MSLSLNLDPFAIPEAYLYVKILKMNSDIEFEITSKLGKTISTSQAYWKIITEIKHPIIKGKQT